MKTKKTKSKKKRRTSPKSSAGKEDGLMKEFLNQIARAGYMVALSLGFRGSFVKFLSELQKALEEVIRQDQKKQTVSH